MELGLGTEKPMGIVLGLPTVGGREICGLRMPSQRLLPKSGCSRVHMHGTWRPIIQIRSHGRVFDRVYFIYKSLEDLIFSYFHFSTSGGLDFLVFYVFISYIFPFIRSAP